jgi:hypothetical protein
MHYCRICGRKFVGFLDTVRHILETHGNVLYEDEVTLYRGYLTRKWSCNDCVHSGVIVVPYDESKPMKKYCPSEHLFDHLNPAEECPNFMPKDVMRK